MSFYPVRLEEEIRKTYPYLLPALRGRECRTMSDSALIVAQLCSAHGVDQEKAFELVGPAHFIHRWRETRVIYAVDPDLASEMKNQAVAIDDDESLPSDFLLNIPYPCFAVESAPFEILARDQTTGEVAHKAQFTGRYMVTTADPDEFSNGWPALSVLFEVPGGSAQYYLPVVPGGTLGDSLRHLLAYFESVREEGDIEYNLDVARMEAMPVLYAAQIVLYIQAQNADLQSRPSPARQKNRRSPMPRQKPPKVIDVGYHIGQTIRKARTAPDPYPGDPENKGGGWTVRPHSRRGHWHHYWTGPRNDQNKRKLILRWTAPMFIHADGKDDKPTLYRIKKEKGDEKS